MKSIFLFLGISLLVYVHEVKAQSSNILISSHWTGSAEIFTSLNVFTKAFTDLDTLRGVSLTQGESTFDATNNRYFNKTNLGITVINAQTGAIIDTITNQIGMKGIEYDPNSNTLVGSYRKGNVEIFTSLNVSTKTFTDLDTLTGVLSLTQGESTFDAANNRYFNKTNLGITVINAQTGAIIDTIANQIGMKGIEYDPNSNTLVGSYRKGNVEIFTSLNVSTKTFTDLDTLTGVLSLTQGESTFDATNNRYFNKTNLGITVINAQTGAIIDTIANQIKIKGIEFNKLFNVGILSQENEQMHLTIYPNPFNSSTTIKLNTNNYYSELDMYNIYGQKIKFIHTGVNQVIKLNRDNLQSGIYFIRLVQNNKIVMTEKLIIID